MKTFSALTLVLALGFLLVSATDADAQFVRGGQRGGALGSDRADRVCFYQDINYQGWEQCYGPGDEVANLNGRRNAISSIRMYGRARVTVYEDTNFRGNSDEFASSAPDLGLRLTSGNKSWSDRIESLRISDEYINRNSNSGRGDRDEQEIRNGICVYEHTNYQGRSECWSTGEEISDLERLDDWGDMISSIRVFGRASAVFYRDIGYRGEELVVDSNMPDLGRFRLPNYGTWNDQISSMEVQTDRNSRGRGLGRGRGRGRGWR